MKLRKKSFIFPLARTDYLSLTKPVENVLRILNRWRSAIMPEMPLFLSTDLHVQVPLETTYQATWNALPDELRRAVETGELPDPDLEETNA